MVIFFQSFCFIWFHLCFSFFFSFLLVVSLSKYMFVCYFCIGCSLPRLIRVCFVCVPVQSQILFWNLYSLFLRLKKKDLYFWNALCLSSPLTILEQESFNHIFNLIPVIPYNIFSLIQSKNSTVFYSSKFTTNIF